MAERESILNELKQEYEGYHSAVASDESELKVYKRDYDRYQNLAINFNEDNSFLENKISLTDKQVTEMESNLERVRNGEVIPEKVNKMDRFKTEDDHLSTYSLHRSTEYGSKHSANILRTEVSPSKAEKQQELQIFKKVVDGYNKKISNLRLKIDHEKRQIKNIKNRASVDFQNKSQYEEFFEECLDRVKRDIYRRKI
eukprot:CAMPEP_0116907490 /NCGR_PEP_ID=MMETSP0467-20121206/13143_1 /TAXON_ID=283647 /ORGANISM="Mesodinium pulex, Strain SPMC105" /LENGTH=197 /DNA_ID=CAMNT_0004582531 /DNA_START=834 /DNA_END=1427 /DNA_ORIENTATION=-